MPIDAIIRFIVNYLIASQVLIKPGRNLVLEDGDRTTAVPGCRLAIDRFAQHARNGVTVMANKRRNLRVGPAFLLEIVNRGAIHIVQHPLCGPSMPWLHLVLAPTGQWPDACIRV